jgi:clan AA aspartic protease
VNPYLDQNHHPHLKTKVFLSDWVEVDCLIDTGFSGGLALPEIFLKQFEKNPAAYQEYELADGSTTNFAVYQGKVNFKNTLKKITLVFTKSPEALVGLEFLDGFRFVLDLKKKQVEID